MGPVYHCIQETYTYRPVFTVGQSPSPLSQVQCHPNPSHRASTMCSNPELLKRRNNTSGKLSPNATTLNGPWTKWRKDLTGLPDRSMMGATILPSLPTMECKVRVTLSYPTHKVFVKVSKGSVVDMASKLTSRVANHQKPSGLP